MARGYSALGDVLRTTADGRSFQELWNELQAVAQAANEQRQRFLDLLTYPTTSAVTSVLQSVNPGGSSVFEEASEYGVPQSTRQLSNVLNMGAGFRWYDAAWRATWQYLADADAAEISANANAIVGADQDHIFTEVMRTIFRSANQQVTDPKSGTVYSVFAFANNDGWVPPDYEANTFPGSHTHYRTSGAATVTSGDLDEIVDDFKAHGLSEENGTQVVFLVNSAQADVISTFRVATGARADFVPASGARFYSPNQLVGTQPTNTFAGFPVKGAYGEALVIETTRIPAGYVVGLASGGRLAPTNPIMFREHARFRGLQLIQGNRPDYPLQDSYWVRGFGTGVRHRLSGHVMQITANANYTAPAIYA